MLAEEIVEECSPRPSNLTLRDRSHFAEEPAEHRLRVVMGVPEVATKALGVVQAAGEVPSQEFLAGPWLTPVPVRRPWSCYFNPLTLL
jgi:hypothetical protein